MSQEKNNKQFYEATYGDIAMKVMNEIILKVNLIELNIFLGHIICTFNLPSCKA